MTSRDFVFWLQGLFEIGGDAVKTLDEKQVAIVRAHLNYVFEHDIAPPAGSPVPTAPKTPTHVPTTEEVKQAEKAMAEFLDELSKVKTPPSPWPRLPGRSVFFG